MSTADRSTRASEVPTIPLYQHLLALREADERFHKERDRRYSEVNIEREKALKIKEQADEAALGLARQIQTYKDEAANELRAQINSERGLYVTRIEFKPVADFVLSQGGRQAGNERSQYLLFGIAGIVLAVAGIAIGVLVK